MISFYKSGFPYLRLCLVQVVVLCIIFTTMKLNTLSVRDPLLLFTLPVEGTTYPQQPACKCLKKSWPGDKETADQLLLSLSWLNNITTYQELQGRHPNLPLDLLYSAENKRCSLLPTLFRYGQRITVSLLLIDLKACLNKVEVHIRTFSTHYIAWTLNLCWSVLLLR